MKLTHIALLAILGAAVATPVLSQPASGQGMGPGAGMGAGMSMGAGKAMRFDASKDNTTGWALMSTEERAAHRDKMQGARTYDECKTTQEAHHKAMEARAKEKGATLPAPRSNGCDRMKANGFFK